MHRLIQANSENSTFFIWWPMLNWRLKKFLYWMSKKFCPFVYSKFNFKTGTSLLGQTDFKSKGIVSKGQKIDGFRVLDQINYMYGISILYLYILGTCIYIICICNRWEPTMTSWAMPRGRMWTLTRRWTRSTSPSTPSLRRRYWVTHK